MFLEIKGKPSIILKLGQLYLLGKRISGDKWKSNNFIGLEEEDDVSQRHCIIEINHNEEAFVFDLFSAKGTLLNNKVLNSLEKSPLKNGDILKVGKQEVKYVHNEQQMFHDNIDFLEVNKNKSGIVASSPDSTSRLEVPINFLVPSIPPKTLNASSSALSVSGRSSDSFTIPETQYCQARNSLNGSNLSVAESVPDNIDGKIKFNFGNPDSFEGDDEFCIPETQEVLQTSGISKNQVPSIQCEVQNKFNVTILEEVSSKEQIGDSQFRICTQDYNEGFGEEESVQSLHSQVIPFIRHQTVNLNQSKYSNMESMNRSNLGTAEKEMSDLNWQSSMKVRETKEIRTDCVTPDIFDFESCRRDSKTNENINRISSRQNTNLVDEDEEDFLPTQILSPASLITKDAEKKILNEVEKPCLEIESEEIVTLSDKENRCPVRLEPATDLQSTQLLETRSQISIFDRKSISSAIKPNTTSRIGSICNSLLNINTDEEDNLLTQSLVQPPNHETDENNLPNKCLNSTFLNNEIIATNQATFFAETDNITLKPSPSTAFKMPERDCSVLKKISYSVSATSDNDIDLLMCTPQLIKDNIFLGRTIDLENDILAAKRKILISDETDEEDDDTGCDLVKLINVPRDSSDFDKLLPHLKRTPEGVKITSDCMATKEAQKIYKFNIPFGKEQDEKHSISTATKSSVLSRDERHVQRDKEKEIQRKGRKKTNEHKEEAMEHKEKSKKIDGRNNQNKNDVPPTTTIENVKEKSINKEQTTTLKSNTNSKKSNQKRTNQDVPSSIPQSVKDSTSEKQVKNARLRKRNASDKKEKEQEYAYVIKGTPARRITRSRSKFLETPPPAEDLDNIATQPIAEPTRPRATSKQNESHESITTSNSKSHKKNKMETSVSPKLNTTTKKSERKRKADALPVEMPVKAERKRLKSIHSQEYPSSTNKISVSMTMVDQELFKNLFKNSKGLWNIATNCADSDVLIMDKPFRTFKFLLSVARGIPIVTSEYLKKLNETGKEVQINKYIFADANFEKKYDFSLATSLQKAKKHKIYKGYEFLMTANIIPKPQEIKTIIEACGGCVHEKIPPQPKENQKLYLVTANEDKKHWHKYRRLNKNIIIVSTEAIMSSVMSQSCDRMNKFMLL